MDRFLREAKLVASLKHPNLAQILSVIQGGKGEGFEGEVYLVFEFVRGRSLDRVLHERGPLPLEEVRRVLRDVCAALDHAHGSRVIHRDLKPSNVMVGEDGSAKVMDFGIAHRASTVSAETRTAAFGTPLYMAPEQERGRVSPASDLYALGVMAYELLTGQVPFDAPSALALWEAKASKTFVPPSRLVPTLRPEADAFFDRALDPEPGQRFPSPGEFLAAFEGIGQTPARA